MAQDEKLAELLANRPKSDRAPTRRLADWSPQVELLTAILNRLGEVAQAIAALGGAKPKTVPPAPFPVTALDRVRSRKRLQRHNALADRVLRRPQQQDGPPSGT